MPDANLTSLALARSLKHRATELGFDRVGITRCDASRYAGYFRRWLDEGRAARCIPRLAVR